MRRIHLAIDYQNRFVFPYAADGRAGEIGGTQLLADCRATVRSLSARQISTLWVTTGAQPDWRRLKPRQLANFWRQDDIPASLAAVMRGYHLVKTGDSAFGNPALLPYLRDRGVQELLISGLYLHHCVAATVTDALQHGLRCTLLVPLLRTHGDDGDTLRRYRLLRADYGLHPAVNLSLMTAQDVGGTKAPRAASGAARAFRQLHDHIVY